MFHFKLNDGQLCLQGQLTRHTLQKKNYQQINQALQTSALVINLKEVKKTDTAGLAWLLYLIEQAKKNNCNLSFVHASHELIKLAKLSNADTLLPINN